MARGYLVNEKPDAILNIIDGTNIERNLYLTTQLIELGIPVVMAVNMIGTLTIIMVVVFVVHLGEAYLADIALIYAMISFLSVVVLCKVYTGIYRERKHEQELLGAKNDNPVETLVQSEKAGEQQ
mgnify:FL=1